MRLALLATTLWLGVPAPPEVTLDWDAPTSCPSTPWIRSRLGVLLSPGARGHVQARVQAGPDRYDLTLAVTTRHGRTQRTLQGPTCDSLAQAAVVVVAVVVDPLEASARSAVSPPSPATAVTPPPPRTSALARADLRQTRPEPARDRRPLAIPLGVTGGGGVGLLPRPHAFTRVRVGLAWRRVDVGLTATHRFAQPIRQPTGGGAVISLSSGGIELGPVVRRGPWSIPLRAGLEAGVMVATGRDLDVTQTALSPWLGAELSAGVAWAPVSWIALRLTAGATGSILRPSFGLDDGTIVYETAPLGARAGLGLEFRLPLDPSRPSRRPRE